MNNQYRIKLEIQLKYINKGINKENYILVIKVLKKDNRFNVTHISDINDYKSLVFNASNEFTIGTNSLQPKGSIEHFSFELPNKKFMNRKITKEFTTDQKRKTYLRHLHKALLEWSNKWGPFLNEPTSKFKTLNNKWYIYITK
jgi:hypothetical protein